MTEEIEPKPEGKIPSAIDAITKLVKADPVLALIVIFGILPLLGGIASAALQGKAEQLPLLLGVLAFIVLLICIPLIVIRTWQDTQYSIKKERNKALTAEANVRMEREKNKQIRFNDLAMAKINHIDASRDYILSQSDRAERDQLHQVVEELREVLKAKGINSVDSVICTENVHKIMQELEKLTMDYDTILESINAIEAALKIPQTQYPVTPEEADKIEELEQINKNIGTTHDELLLETSDLKKVIQEKDHIITGLRDDIRIMREKEPPIPEKEAEQFPYDSGHPLARMGIDKPPEPEFVPKTPEELDEKFNDIISEVHGTQKAEELDEAPLQEALSILDGLEDKENDGIVEKIKSTIKSAKDVAVGIVPTSLRSEVGFAEETEYKEQMEKDVKEVYGISEGLPSEMEIVDVPAAVQQKPSPPEFHIICWECPKCNRKNDMKKIRCPACGSSKPR